MAKRIDPATVAIVGDAGIKSVGKIHKQFQLALKKNGSIELDLDKATDFDLAFVQLVESARRTATTEGKTVSLSAPVRGGLLEILKRGGFLADAAGSGFWLANAGGC
jgi:hypothetical protein